jgi:hypothetical protein
MTELQEPSVPMCHSARDGDCIWEDCPQAKDWKTYCPYAAEWERYWTANGDDFR